MKTKHVILSTSMPIAKMALKDKTVGTRALRDFIAEAKEFDNLEARDFHAEAEAFKAISYGGNISAASLNVEVKDLTFEEAKELKRYDSSVLETAPAMPISLIEPVGTDDVPALPAGQYTWGIKAVGADSSPFTGKGITVAVLDTGIDKSHPAFSGLNIVSKNFTSGADEDTNGHGTHCAGTIFGRDVNGLRIGVAPGVQDVIIGKVLGAGGGDTATIQEAIHWAIASGAEIISMSLGIDFPGYVERITQENPGRSIREITSMALYAYRKNLSVFNTMTASIRATRDLAGAGPVLFIAAAGNESSHPAFSVAASPPAAAEGFISVGAVMQSNNQYSVATFSNSEPIVSGPGVGIISAKRGGGITSKQGTSMAAPHVAGVAALWAEHLKSIDQYNYNVLNAKLIASCNAKLLQGQKAFNYGAGIVQAPQ